MPEAKREEVEIQDLRGDLAPEELIFNVRKDNQAWEEHFSTYARVQWEESIKLWQAEHLTQPRAGRSKLFIQKPRSGVRRIGADLLDAFFSSSDFVTIEPGRQGLREDVIGAKVRQAYINHVYAGNPIKWFNICFSAFDDGCVLNMIVAEVAWVKEIDRIRYKQSEPVLDPFTGQSALDPATGGPLVQEVEKELEVTLRDEPQVRLIPPDRVAFDPRASWEDIYTGQFIIHKDPMFYQDLLKLSETDAKIDKEAVHTALTFRRLNTNTIAQTRQESSYTFDDPHRKEIEVWKYYYKVMGKWWVAWLNEDKSVLRSPEPVQDKHGMPPIIMAFLDPESHKVYSPSKVHQNRDNFVQLNGIRNQRMDNVARVMNQHAIVSRDANVDLASLVNRRPMGYTLADGDPRMAVHYEQVPDMKASSYNEETLVDRDIQELFGVSDLSQGIDPKQDELATQSVIRQQNTNKKAAVNIRMIAETFIIQVTRRVLQLADEHVPLEKLLEIVGPDEEMAGYILQRYGQANDDNPTMDQIRGQYNVKVYAGLGFFSKDAQLKNYDIAFQRLLTGFGPDAVVPILGEYLSLLGVRNANEVVQRVQQISQVTQLLTALSGAAKDKGQAAGNNNRPRPAPGSQPSNRQPGTGLREIVAMMRGGQSAPI